MADSIVNRHLLLDQLANEFAERYRRGERPALTEYVNRHPELAAEIREFFPAMVEIEVVKAAAEPATSDDFRIPQLERLGDFRILREIGRGGMGVVYEAEQIALGRRVALKLLTQRMLRDATQKRRFEREAKAAARLHHTNIVPVFGFGEHEGTPYYVMQFIQGLGLDLVAAEVARLNSGQSYQAAERDTSDITQSLVGGEFTPTSRLESDLDTSGHAVADTSDIAMSMTQPGSSASGKFTGHSSNKLTYFQGVARIGIQVADALEYAHRQGVIHRDIKPSNLLLDLAGTTWVTDFGLAKCDDQENLTHSGDMLGTVRYMPPEAFDGVSDARGDVYSLGITLYELLALRPAYDVHDRHKLLKAVTTSEPPRLRSVRPSVPRDLETVIHKAMAREPVRRYKTPADLAEDLKCFIDGRPITARRTTELEKLWMWSRRRPAMAGLVAALFLCLLAGSIISTMFAVRAEGFARAAASREKDATIARDAAMEARSALSRTLADSYAILGQIAGDRGDAALAALWFAKAATQATEDTDLETINRIRVRNWTADGVLAPVAAVDVTSHSQRLEFHPSGQYLTGRTSTGTWSVWDISTSTLWQSPPGWETPTALAWDRTGKRMVLGRTDRVGIFAFPSGEAIHTWDWPGPVAAAAFSPDGDTVALGGTSVQIWDWRSARPASPRWIVPQPIEATAFTPDGSRVVTLGSDQVMRVYSVAGSGTEPELSTPNHSTGPPQFLDKGGAVITFPTTSSASSFDLITRKEKFRIDIRGDNGWESKLATSHDGKSIWAPTTNGKNVAGWNAEGQSIAEGFPHLNSVFSLAVSPDDSLLASGAWDRTLRIWDLKTRALRFPEMVSISSPVTVAWANDGRRLAAAYEGRYQRVWALPAGLPVRNIEPGGAISMARFAPDSRSLLAHSGTNNLASQRQVCLIDPATGKTISPVVNLNGALLAADVTANGRQLITATTHLSERKDESPEAPLVFTSKAGEVRFWDIASGQSEGGAIKVPAEPRDVRFRPDGSEAAVVCAGREILILDPATGRIKRTFKLRPFQLPPTFHVGNHQLCYSRDGNRLYVYGPNGCGLDVLHSETGETLFKSGKEVFDVRESSDGAIVAVAYGRNDFCVRQFDTRTFQEVAPLIRHPDWVFGVRFDKSGDRLLTSCRDRAARLWDRKSGQMLAVYPHENEVVAAEFFGDDRFVISVAHDQVARLSDAATGRPIAPPIKLGGLGLSIDVSPDGRWAVAGGFTTRLTVVDLRAITQPADGTAHQVLRNAELFAGRRIDSHGGVVNLTVDEWKERWEEYRTSLTTRK